MLWPSPLLSLIFSCIPQPAYQPHSQTRTDLHTRRAPLSLSLFSSFQLSSNQLLHSLHSQQEVKTTRSTKVLKSSSPSSPISSFSAEETPKAKKAVAIKKALSESRESSEQPETDGSYPSRTPGHTNVTHPRRAAQNRAAQRTFRNRRKAYIKELEVRVSEIDKTRELMEAVQAENREIWRRFQMLENLVSSNGLQLPAFPPMTSLAATTLSADGVSSISVVTGNEYGLDNTNMMMLNHPNHLGHSDNE
ncbi:hypothetical protein B0O80DRAFT_199557 [Mortierella sp. GBAus27b]|nr:hypothetical protein B0O80DRAFT_199557 [Mortierella sp. GBAus27b]